MYKRLLTLSLALCLLTGCGSQPEPTPSPVVEQFSVNVINGTISNPSADNKYAKGTTLTAYANVDFGKVFENWVSEGEVISKANPYTFEVTKNITLEAITSTIETYKLVVNGGYGSGEYPKGAHVTVTANVPEHKSFSHWLVAEQVVSTTETYTFVINADTTIDAVCNDTIYQVNVTNGHADVSEGVYGTTVTLTSDPEKDKFCIGWLINGLFSSNNSFVLEGNTDCEPVYETPNLAVSMLNQYKTHTAFDIPCAKMTAGDLVINATGKVITPSKQELTKDIVLNESGTYEIVYSATHDNSTVTKSVFFDAVDTVSYVSSSSANVVQSIVPNGNPDGIFYTLHNESEVLVINNELDIGRASFDNSYVLAQVGFKPGDTALASADIVELTLTDVDDPLNFIQIKLENIPSYSGKTFVSARAAKQEYQNIGEPVVCDMTGRTEEFQANILVDYNTGRIAGGNSSNVIADLVNVEDNPWKGFTNGKAILTITAKYFVDDDAQYSLGYVDDSRAYVVKSKGGVSYRSSENFYLYNGSTYSLTGYEIDVTKATSATYFFMSPVFDATYINATIVVKVIDTTDDSNFFYIVIESLTSANLRLSASSDGKPDLDNLVGSNQYAQAGGQLNVTLNLTDRYVSNWNNATGTCPVPESFTNCNSVRLEFTADCDINFKLEYLGDTKTWCHD